MSNDYANRTFQSPDDIVTGKSVVIENSQDNTQPSDILSSNRWPYDLTDYLKTYIGKPVQVKYELSGGRFNEKQGTLMVVGTNFIAIQPNFSEDLFIMELSVIRCVNVLNYKKKPLSRQDFERRQRYMY